MRNGALDVGLPVVNVGRIPFKPVLHLNYMKILISAS